MSKIYRLEDIGEVFPVSAGDNDTDIYVQTYKDEEEENDTI